MFVYIRCLSESYRYLWQRLLLGSNAVRSVTVNKVQCSLLWTPSTPETDWRTNSATFRRQKEVLSGAGSQQFRHNKKFSKIKIGHMASSLGMEFRTWNQFCVWWRLTIHLAKLDLLLQWLDAQLGRLMTQAYDHVFFQEQSNSLGFSGWAPASSSDVQGSNLATGIFPTPLLHRELIHREHSYE